MQNAQICGVNIKDISFFEQDVEPIKFRKPEPGRGHTKDGFKKTWRKICYFKKDLLAMKFKQVGGKEFKNHFSGTSAADIDLFWSKLGVTAATAIGYINEVADCMIKSFKHRNMITVSSEEQTIK